MGTRNEYSEEFKQEAVRLIEEGASVRRVAADLDVSEWTIRGWLKKVRESQVAPKRKLTVEEENRQLKAEVRQLKLERENPLNPLDRHFSLTRGSRGGRVAP